MQTDPEFFLPFVPMPGADRWVNSYERGEQMAVLWPGQDTHDLCYAIEYNASWPEGGITNIKMMQQGENDGPSWIWHVTMDNEGEETTYVIEGWCDFTGWDCQSGVDISVLNTSFETYFAEVQKERDRQLAKFGVQDHNPYIYLAILGEEVGEACQAAVQAGFEPGGAGWNDYRTELIQVATVALAMVEAYDRNGPEA